MLFRRPSSIALSLTLFASVGAGAGEWKREQSPVDAACSHLGPNFVAVPGSRTCVRLSGRALAEVSASSGRTRAPLRSETGARLSADVRTETEFGPARGFVRFGTGAR